MIYLDSETCGLTGPMVLFQYAEDDGPIVLYEIWEEPVEKTLKLFEYITTQEICGFNLTFDWFHVNKIYNILREMVNRGYDPLLRPNVQIAIEVEKENPSKYCLKPKAPLDLMLYARTTKYQHTMGRRQVTIRRVPTSIASDLKKVLEAEVKLPATAFSKKYEWQVKPIDENLVDLVLKFSGSTSLRAIAADCLGESKEDWPDPPAPTEYPWKPYGQNGKLPWGVIIYEHIEAWKSPGARKYAWKDVDITRKLRYYFSDAKPNDTDSILACAVGAARWRGFEIDHSKLNELVKQYSLECKDIPIAPTQALNWLKTFCTPVEALVIKSTNKETLKNIVKNGSTPELRNAANTVIKARRAAYRLSLLNRLKQLDKLHPDFKIVGTKSNRQSGGSEGVRGKSINPQGIPKNEIREVFRMHGEEEELWGGDAQSYEVTIIDAVFPDKQLRADLSSGKNFHALLGQLWYDESYEEMMEKKKSKDPIYDRVKAANFAYFYGAEQTKMEQVLGVPVAESMKRFFAKYPDLYRRRNSVGQAFCSMRQTGGVGSKIVWEEPADYIESLLGFKRFFTLENTICRALYRIANEANKYFGDQYLKQQVVRKVDRGPQTVLGATATALYATAFGLQAANMRAACNHVIQSVGGHITKEFQRELVELQPCGVHPWVCRTFNMHDEILSTVKSGVDTTFIRDRVMSKYRKIIPLIAWDWQRMQSWGDKS